VPYIIDNNGVAPTISAQGRPSVTSRAPPKFALEGNKWCVENHEGNKNIVIDQTEIKQLVYIYGCNNCTIQIKGKVNAVTLGKLK
jgi:adenylyl cyclase-associated protein